MILSAFVISIEVVTISIIITLLISLGLIFLLKDREKTYRNIVEILILLPMFIPPSAIGYLILIVLGKSSVLGGFLNRVFNISIIFTIWAAVIAAILVTLPIMYQNIKTALESVDSELKDSARSCGANEFIVFTKITLPLAKNGILNAILLSFARAFGEFGATILVAGNIPGKTQTIPMAMYYAIEGNNTIESLKILVVILVVAIFMLSIYRTLSIKRN